MRGNRTLARRQQGKGSLGPVIGLASHDPAELAAHAGFDRAFPD
jgi:hypothetical protein